MVDVAEIKIWGEFVGAVLWDEKRKIGSFQYHPEFIRKGWDLSPIKMPISNGSRVYQFPELKKSKDAIDNAFNSLPGLLSDSLPDN